jgi:biotin carboxylase
MNRESILMLVDDSHFERACADLNVDVTVVYGAPQRDWGMMVVPSGKRQVFVEDARNIESVILGLYRAGLTPSTFDAIYSTTEGGVLTAAALGAAFGVPSIPVQVAAAFRDKALAKAAISKAGIDTAEFIVIDDLHGLAEDFSMPFETAVLKPVAGGAAHHASMIESDADLQAAAKRAREHGKLRTFILEEFISGEEWHADGVMFGGSLRFISVGGYRKTCLGTISDKEWLRTYVFDPVADVEVYDRVTPLAEQALQTLGLEDGVFHMELFYDAESDRLAFGECAARRGGALIEEEVCYQFGVSLAEMAVHCALGTQPVIKPDVRPGVVGSAYLPYTPGILHSTPSAAELTALPNVEFAMVEWPIGITLEPVVSTAMKIGQVLLTASSREELFQRGDEVVSWFRERTVIVPTQATSRELREWYARTAVDGSRAHSSWKRKGADE